LRQREKVYPLNYVRKIIWFVVPLEGDADDDMRRNEEE
jgi:hypothetical protein